MNTETEDIELQLLFVVMDEQRTVIKVEIGQMPRTPDINFYGNLNVVNQPFAKIQSAIDELDEKPLYKPLPRLEREKHFYRFYRTDDVASLHSHCIDQEDYDAFTTLIGRPLPLYDPKKGEWTRLLPLEFPLKDESAGIEQTKRMLPDVVAQWVKDTQRAVPLEVWRYVRRVVK